MSPTQSTSTRSVHNESDVIGIQDVCYLSDYAFQIQRNSVASSTHDQITAVCTYKDGKNARQAIQVPSSTQLDGWYVEANETEATVYGVIKVAEGGTEYTSDLDTGDWTPVQLGHTAWVKFDNKNYSHTYEVQGTGGTVLYDDGSHGYISIIAASDTYDTPGILTTHYNYDGSVREQIITKAQTAYTHNGKTVYYAFAGAGGGPTTIWKYRADQIINGNSYDAGAVAWTFIYGTSVDPEYETKTVLIGRFAIELKDAGGVGPGSDWDDPGDWNEDWEEGDPTQTLHVEVIGALSGRHNDPIEDPSYSYIPADKETVKGYGCGGDGGHGGGGGAGASTVVVYKFATNQADGKEIVALAKRHGYGSGGGKGGKGGDGCILVYY